MEAMCIDRKWPKELRLAYVAIWFFIVAQHVVNERLWEQILRIAGMLAFIASLSFAARQQRRG
jgi:hypothetical protein